jgi:hypothetical protein
LIALLKREELPAEDSGRRASLEFNGLSALPFLFQGLIAALEELSDAYPNILALNQESSERTKNFVKRASPLVYSPVTKKGKQSSST